MAIKTSELVGYFASLATAHKKISHVENVSKHFYRMELNEFAAGTAMFNGYNLILEVMPIKYTAPSRDNLFKIREVSFIVVKSIKPNNRHEIDIAFDETEVIVEDILSKLNGYVDVLNTKRIYYDLETVVCEQVSDGKCYGIRCSLDIKNTHSLEIQTANWF